MLDHDDLADLTVELNALLNAWDPIGVADLVDDEYLALTGTVLALLGRGASRASVCQFFYETVAPDYGADPEAADRFGATVWAWYQSKQPRPD